MPETMPMRVIRGTDFEDIKNGFTENLPIRFIPKKEALRKILEPWDVLIETAGGSKNRPTGRTVLITPRLLDELDSVVSCASFARFLRFDPSLADSRFIYWFLQDLYNRGLMEAHQVQHTGVARFQFTRFAETIRVPLPLHDEQRRIAEILGAFDDKIELNRKMNRTLEAMAQALFKSWFVDFDGHDDLVDSELGPIPRGWKVGALQEIASLRRDMINPNEVPHDTPYWGLADMPRSSIALDQWGVSADATSRKATCLRGDVLFGKLRPYFKKIGVAPCNGICSSEILVIKAEEPQWAGYVLGALTLDSFVDQVSAAATGTRMPRTNWKTMSSLPIVLPTRPYAEAFDRFTKVVVDKIHANIWQSKTLAEIRDTLLPKLISGEVRVPEAQKIAETAL